MFKILAIGCGNMGGACLQAMLVGSKADDTLFDIVDRNTEKRKIFESLGVRNSYSKVPTQLDNYDAILLGIKPLASAELLFGIKNALANVSEQKRPLLISMMAGITMDALEQNSGIHKRVRIMPNLPVRYGRGTCAWYPLNLNAHELKRIEVCLQTMGQLVRLDSDDALDRFTALIGSGPGYCYYFIDAMAHAAKTLGFEHQEASEMLAQTFLGSLELFQKANTGIETWKDRVASKGGSTREAYQIMDDANLQNCFTSALNAAYQRNVELRKGSENEF